MNNLKYYRRAAGYSMNEFAHCIGISKKQYEAMERGDIDIPDNVQAIIVGLIAEGLGEFIDIDEIFA